MLPRAGGRRNWPLADVRRRILPFIPLVTALGLLASLLEGAGIGLFVPLLALLLNNPASASLPEPLKAFAALFSGASLQSRTILFGAAIVGLILLKNIVQAVNECLLVSVRGRIGRDIRNGLARSLLSVDYTFFLTQDAARLTRIISTDSWFVLEAARSALALIPAAAALLVFGILLALLNLKLFLFILVGAAAVQGAIYLFERRQQRLSYEFTASNRVLWERHLTILQAPRVIRLFGQQAREQQRAAAAIDRLWQSLRATSYLNAVVQPSVDVLIALLFLTVLLAGYWSGMSIPAITAFLLLLTRAQPHAKAISRARLGIASFEGSMREVDWLLSQATPVPAVGQPDSDLRLDRPISFEGVNFSYPNGGRALDQASFTIEPGITTALLGESGSGKTTLINLLCRLVEPGSGAIRLGDDTIDAIDPASWRRRIAVAGQDSDLVTGTVAENIAYGRPDAAAAEIEAAARAAGADTFIAALPQGYDTPVGPHGINLSGGQRQRVGVARALLLNPDLLIFDEATNAVDALSDMEIVKLASEHHHFRTLLIVSHRKTTIAACQRGVVLEDGKVVETGPLDELAYFRTMAGDPDG
jgi:ABC-type multidrug transport system fused ATPase/permease subunit